MNDAIIVQQGSGLYADMLDITHGLHRKYAERHDMDFLSAYRESSPAMEMGWSRWHLLRWALSSYQFVFWLDADCAIVGDDNLRDACMADISMMWGQVGGEPAHYNSGAMYMRGTDNMQALAGRMIDYSPVARLESFTGPWHGENGRVTCDQYTLNEMCRSQRWGPLFAHADDCWNSMPHYNPVDNPVVLAWHGLPVWDKLTAMRTASQKWNRP